MKEILQQIINTYFNNDAKKYKLLLDKDLLIILDSEGKESDFFHFIFEDEGNIEKINSEKIYKNLKESDTNNEFKNIESFEKNLNFIYFVKRSDYKNNPFLNKQAYLIEENPYYAKEKVIFYTETLIDNFSNFSLDTGEIKSLVEGIPDEHIFILDILVGLTFIKVDFPESIRLQVEKKVFQDSYITINKEYKLFNMFHDEKFTNSAKITGEEEFRKKIKEIKDKRDEMTVTEESNYNTIIKGRISDFEKDVLDFFGEGKDELENYILSFKLTEDENT